MYWNRNSVLNNAESCRQHLLIPENLFMALIAAFYMENCIFKRSTYNLITEKRESREILDITPSAASDWFFSLSRFALGDQRNQTIYYFSREIISHFKNIFWNNRRLENQWDVSINAWIGPILECWSQCTMSKTILLRSVTGIFMMD